MAVETLTTREAEVAAAVSRGLRNRQIAAEFGISEQTVKRHLATIYGKLDLSGRLALAIHVLRSETEGAEPSGGAAIVALRPDRRITQRV